MSKEVGERVQAVRAGSGLSQRDFASRLGISSGGISQIETGKTMPGGEFLLRLHQEFKADVTWVLTGVSAGGELPPASPREAALLDNYRNSPDTGKDAIERTAFALAQQAGMRKAK